ncbi:ankyrin repeat domain-containing protein [Pseudoalteromonas luteoviolacea]|uniref:ankyrin repeat domain-containing protein n=1 Tax=Pseudoalteromonas luteoviolacea TaxID=43657 RepID=UPI001F4802B1|nr:ankyrin repeat domain-containing protein [Pseudoalteromonas luteoviolacea]MCF6437933.1 ankyrin repeat domain-containing protein [Pseudoalteromonas luteoviolacea]
MEQVLIWPSQFPLLLKGLVEDNGAFILDALEAWPECEVVKDEQGVIFQVLPPIFYVAWLKPLDPFESCFFQHIDDYDEEQHYYVAQLLNHIEQAGVSRDELTVKLLGCLSQYSSIASQAKIQNKISFIDLLLKYKQFKTLCWLLPKGFVLSPAQTCELWIHGGQHSRDCLTACYKEVLENMALTQAEAVQSLNNGYDCEGLLTLLCNEEERLQILDNALLEQVMSGAAKQSSMLSLIEKGARGHGADSAGKSAMMWIVEKGFVSAAQALKEFHGGISLDDLGRNLMHYAVLSNSRPMLELVEDMGVDPRLADAAGCTPYRLATEHQSVNSKKYLEKRGIIELSEEAKYQRILRVYILKAFTVLILPLQLVLFLDVDRDNKLSMVLLLSSCTLFIFALARLLKNRRLFPTTKLPLSLRFLGALSWVSLFIQAIFTVVMCLAVVTI